MRNYDEDLRVANIAGISVDYLNQLIFQIQTLLNRGFWFSDACEIISILTNFKQRASNYEDTESMIDFWNEMSDICYAPEGTELITPTPIF